MELFKIERFGVEYNEDWKQQQSDALKLKIEKRRLKLLHDKSSKNNNSHSDVTRKRKHDSEHEDQIIEGDEKKKIKKKEKVLESPSENKDCNTEKEDRKKKKKSKKKDSSCDIESNESHDEEVETPLIQKVKKKKRKCSESKHIDEENNNGAIASNKNKKKSKEEEEEFENKLPDNNEKDNKNALDHSIDGDTSEMNASTMITESDDPVVFPILEKQKHEKKSAVRRALPRWLNEPHLIPLQFKDNQLCLDDCQQFLNENTITNLKKVNITDLFPVQAKIVPEVMRMHKMCNPCFPKRSVCVQSPTGSGKTLSYVLPIVEILSRNIIRELYCLVIVPSKELAMQVKQVFDHFVIGTNLKVALFSGTKSIASEQERVVVKRKSGYKSLVDIVVTTSGRLMDHLKRTEGFSLQHLKFLVIDEADKMLTSENDSWVPLVINSIHSGICKRTYPLTANHFSKPAHYVQKFLFSATLTQSPEKIAPLELYNPVLFTTQGRQEEEGDDDTSEHVGGDELQKYLIPENLTQKMTVVPYSQKPLVLVHVVCSMGYKRVLCFTNSLESTHRLFLLLKAMDRFTVSEFSSRLTEQQRKSILREFRENKISVLIATDAMSRGMDIDDVELVVNYDAPLSAKRYVHRAGRTARAGCEGETLTILLQKESRRFTNMTTKWLSGGKPVERIKITKDDLSEYEEKYESALEELRTRVQEENNRSKPKKKQINEQPTVEI